MCLTGYSSHDVGRDQFTVTKSEVPLVNRRDDFTAQGAKFIGERPEGLRRKFFDVADGGGGESGQPVFRHDGWLFAGNRAAAGRAGHRLHRGEAGEAAGDEGEEHQAKENATQKLCVSLN